MGFRVWALGWSDDVGLALSIEDGTGHGSQHTQDIALLFAAAGIHCTEVGRVTLGSGFRGSLTAHL